MALAPCAPPFQKANTPNSDVVFSVISGTGLIELNRPKALNALTPAMMIALRRQLLAWKNDVNVRAIIVRSTSQKAFCAGGDLRAVHGGIQTENFDDLEILFREEYLLNHMIYHYPKPYISFIDGIVMGGGVGLCVHGSHRLVSENTRFAMPETNIGFFPDVGATSFLNQAPGKVGLYLGLTGNHLSVADMLYAKIGTHFLPHDQHEKACAALLALPKKTPAALNELLKNHQDPFPKSPLKTLQLEIDTLFSPQTLQGIFHNLVASKTDFAAQTLATLQQRSPTSLAITFEQLRRGKNMGSFDEMMDMEFDLSQNLVHSADFPEGIRAAIIDKDYTPQWSPRTIDTIQAETIDAYFTKHPLPLI